MSAGIDVLADVCFACGRKLGKRAERMLVDTRDGQEVHVGADCFKHVQAAGSEGYQPPKGGPRLYPLTTDGALAVMARCCASLSGDESEQLHQARAAVAELIEAANRLRATLNQSGYATADLDAALARVGGAS